MTASAERRHYQLLQELSQPGRSLSRGSAHESLLNPDWYDAKAPTDQRKMLFQQAAVPVEHNTTTEGRPPLAILTAGPPGAGKSSSVATALELLGDDRRFRIIDPDRIKDDLLKASLHDGSYHSWLMPKDVWALHAAGERFHPRELAGLVQAESGRLAGALRNDAIAAKADFVMEGILHQRSLAAGMVKKLGKAGYDVTVVNVQCTQDQAVQRCHDRWLSGRQAALQAEADERIGWDARLGGRFVPPEFIASCFDRESGRPLSDAVASDLLRTRAASKLLTFAVRDGDPTPQLDSIQRWDGERLQVVPGQEAVAGLALQRRRANLGLTADAIRRVDPAAAKDDPSVSRRPARGFTPRRPRDRGFGR